MKRGNILANLDWITVMIYIILLFLGWLNIFSSVYSEEHPNILDLNQRYGKQFLWIIAAIIIAVTIIIIDSRFYEFFGYLIYGMAILLLLLVLVAGKEINGSKSWLALGSFQIQPSEFAKPAVALALAKYLSTYNINIHKLNTILKFSLIIFLPCILILMQPDAGSALVFIVFVIPIYREGFSAGILLILFGSAVLFLLVLLVNDFVLFSMILAIGLIAYYIICRSIRKTIMVLLYYLGVYGIVLGMAHLFGGAVSYYKTGIIAFIILALIFSAIIFIRRIPKVIYVIMGVAVAVIFNMMVSYGFHHFLSDYHQHRINIMLGIESDPRGVGYNVNQSMIAIGSGGFSGKGYLNGTQTKLRFVPEQSTDFIFCTVGEEWGFLGATAIIILFLVLFYRLIILAERQRNSFARIFGYSTISVLFFHFAINIAMTLGIFPVIGIPLPFFSYGGSSLWAFTIILFIFLRLDASRMDFYR